MTTESEYGRLGDISREFCAPTVGHGTLHRGPVGE
jgi:hypothetical protein